jgi:hypothetical protein
MLNLEKGTRQDTHTLVSTCNIIQGILAVGDVLQWKVRCSLSPSASGATLLAHRI